VVWQGEISVKIEVSPVLRGSVYPEEFGELSARARAAFGFARVKLLSFEDLYAGSRGATFHSVEDFESVTNEPGQTKKSSGKT
jgi:hypothetical protein